MGKIIEINTDQIEKPEAGNNLFENRALFAGIQQSAAEVSIIIVAYNRLDKTRRCVESVLEHTAGIDYELILIDSGSQDGTLEYYKSVSYDKKRIIHITKNLGAAFAYATLELNELGRFICIVQNDLIVTHRWLDNLLACMKSDIKIGMVNPVSSNTSNLQCVELLYHTYEEMQQKAKMFNCSDPRRWEDRIRLVTLGTLYRKEVFLAAGWPMGDMGFFHDFFDDDVAFSVRRLGYRTVLAGDTWVCHDHDLKSGEGKDPVEFQRSLETGRSNFREKYYGIDAWDDVHNVYSWYLSNVPLVEKDGEIHVLGVDVRCGTPLLDIKNWLRKAGMFQTELSAFTRDPKYWLDLKSVCEGSVLCDCEERLSGAFPTEYYEYVVMDYPFNCCKEPRKVLKTLFSFCKKEGVVICRLKNTFSFREYAHILGVKGVYDKEFSYNIPLEEAESMAEEMGNVIDVIPVPLEVGTDGRETLERIIPENFPQEQRTKILQEMLCSEYILFIQKS